MKRGDSATLLGGWVVAFAPLPDFFLSVRGGTLVFFGASFVRRPWLRVAGMVVVRVCLVAWWNNVVLDRAVDVVVDAAVGLVERSAG